MNTLEKAIADGKKSIYGKHIHLKQIVARDSDGTCPFCGHVRVSRA